MVVWRPPQEPSGIILRYELRFEQSDDKIVKFDANSNFFITEDAQRSLNALVEVRQNISTHVLWKNICEHAIASM